MNKTTILTLGAISLMNIATASTWNEVFQNGAFVSGGGEVTLSENVSGGSGGILGNTEQGTVSVDLDHKELSFTGEWLPFCVYGGTESALTYFDNGIVNITGSYIPIYLNNGASSATLTFGENTTVNFVLSTNVGVDSTTEPNTAAGLSTPSSGTLNLLGTTNIKNASGGYKSFFLHNTDGAITTNIGTMNANRFEALKGHTVNVSGALNLYESTNDNVFYQDSASSVTFNSGAALNVHNIPSSGESNAVRVASSSLTFKSGSSATLAGNLSVITQGTLTVESGATFTTSMGANFDGGIGNFSGNLDAETMTIRGSSKVTFNSGTTTYIASALNLGNTSVLTINGDVNAEAPTTSFNVGEHFAITSTSNTAYSKFILGKNAAMTVNTFSIDANSKAEIAGNLTIEFSSTSENLFNGATTVLAGGEINTKEVVVNGVITTYGKVNLSASSGLNGSIIVEKGGSISSPNIWSWGGKITVNAQEAGVERIVDVLQLSLDGGKLVLNSKNALAERTYLSVNRGNYNVEINADQDFSYFNFNTNFTTDVNYANINVKIGSGVELISLDSLTNGSIVEVQEGKTRNLIFEDFRNYVIHVDSNKEESLADFFSHISIKDRTLQDGEYFAFVADSTNGGYWLNVIPEPSTYATIFGFIALGFAMFRRRK